MSLHYIGNSTFLDVFRIILFNILKSLLLNKVMCFTSSEGNSLIINDFLFSCETIIETININGDL